MALKTAYATAAEADVFLATRADWIALTDAVKDAHLLNATYYLDQKYTCSFATPINDEAGYACSLLAYHDFATGLFVVNEAGNNIVVEDAVEIQGIKLRTKYSGANSSSQLRTVDPYPDATAILGGLCYLTANQGVGTAKVVRT